MSMNILETFAANEWNWGVNLRNRH